MNNSNQIDGNIWQQILACGFASLCEKEEEINKLNVFPVPDGDTGANMRMTYASGIKLLEQNATSNIGEAAAIFAKGTLLGARGNSGVILSQIFKGIALGLKDIPSADVNQLAAALRSGVEKSYKAVIKPVEGTILTVNRECCEYVENNIQNFADVQSLICALPAVCEKSLQNTPNLLDVLREAGVVDSGGAGLMYILRGFSRYFSGESAEDVPVLDMPNIKQQDVEFGYCTEFLLKLSDVGSFDVKMIVAQLEAIGGESIVALCDEDVLKVHVHVKTPGDVLNIAQQYGEFVSVKVENMTLQHNELSEVAAAVAQPQKGPRVPLAVVVVSGDDGFCQLFTDMGANYIVSGGQSMNPSVQDFLQAFDTVNADDIIVCPNNGNVVLTAQQASNIYGNSRVHIVETKTLAQGFAAMSLFNPEEELQDLLTQMRDAMIAVISVEVTRAVRNSCYEGLQIENGDVIAIVDGKIKGSNPDIAVALVSSLEGANVSQKEFATVFVGANLPQEQAEHAIAALQKAYPNLEVSTLETNQSIYDLLIAID